MNNKFRQKLENFVSFSDREISILEDLGRHRRTIAPQTVLTPEGEAAGSAFLIHAGWAIRYGMLADGRRQIQDFVLPGDIAGLLTFATRLSDHSLMTVTEAVVSEIEPQTIRTLMQHGTRLGGLLLWSLAHEKAILRGHIVAIGRRSAYERTAYLLLELWRRLTLIGIADDRSFEFPLTQVMLADALGLSIVHINRTLRRLQEDGYIRIGSRSIQVLDAVGLSAVAEFDDARLHLEGPPAGLLDQLGRGP